MRLVLGHLSTPPSVSARQQLCNFHRGAAALLLVVRPGTSTHCHTAVSPMLVIRAFFPAGTLLAKYLNHGQLAKASKKHTEVRTNPDPNRSQSHLPIGAQKRPHLRPKSGPAGTFCETKMGSPGETKMCSPGETPHCFSIVKASPRGGRIVSPGELILVLLFCSPVRGPALLLVSPKGRSSRTRAAPCLPPPSTKLRSLGPLPRFVFCNETRIRWSVSSAGRAIVVSRPMCLVAVCPCLSDTPAARR